MGRRVELTTAAGATLVTQLPECWRQRATPACRLSGDKDHGKGPDWFVLTPHGQSTQGDVRVEPKFSMASGWQGAERQEEAGEREGGSGRARR